MERCGNETCQFGARCKHNQVEGSLKCSCDFYCDQESKKPVCGSDGVTYSNKCTLSQAACEGGSFIQVVKQGACESDSNEGRVDTIYFQKSIFSFSYSPYIFNFYSL